MSLPTFPKTGSSHWPVPAVGTTWRHKQNRNRVVVVTGYDDGRVQIRQGDKKAEFVLREWRRYWIQEIES